MAGSFAQLVRALFNQLNQNDNVVYRTYPTQALLGGAAGAVLNSGGAWLFNAVWVEIATAATFTTEYWLCALLLQAAALAEQHEVNLGFGVAGPPIVTTSVARIGFNSAAFSEGNSFDLPYPRRIAAGQGVWGTSASVTGGGTVTAKVLVATGLL